MDVFLKRHFLTKDESRFYHIRTKSFFWDVGITYVSIVATFSMLTFASGTFAVSFLRSAAVFIVIGLLQYRLLHAAHEACHQDFRPGSKSKNLVAILVAYPIGLTKSFRTEHLLHHSYFGDPERDPDYPTFGVSPSSRIGYLVFVLKGFSGVAAIEQVVRRIRSTKPDAAARIDSLLLVASQLVLLIVFTVSISPESYFLFWLLPLLTIVKGLAQLRGLAEHGDPVPHKYVLRSFLNDGIVALFMGNMGFRHHAGHHLYPMVPYEHLQMVREKMLSSLNTDSETGISIEIYPGSHLSILREWYLRLPWRISMAVR